MTEEPTLLSKILLKYIDKKPMKFGTHEERTYPISAVIDMIQEYHEEKIKPDRDTEYNPKWTPSQNLINKIRWGTDDEQHDLAFYLDKWFNL